VADKPSEQGAYGLRKNTISVRIVLSYSFRLSLKSRPCLHILTGNGVGALLVRDHIVS
jgi:hypothetical protein